MRNIMRGEAQTFYLLLFRSARDLRISLLVSPVSSNTILSNEMHLVCSDLDLHWLSIWQPDNCVKGSIAIGFRLPDVVLEAISYFWPQLVHLQPISQHERQYFHLPEWMEATGIDLSLPY